MSSRPSAALIYNVRGESKTALLKSVSVSVTDGQLNIDFIKSVDEPMIDAIEVLPH